VAKEKKLNRFAIAFNGQIPHSRGIAEEIRAFFLDQGAQVLNLSKIDDQQLQPCIHPQKIDAIIVLGGDGTMLRASHLCSAPGIPIVGINLGTMGFLIELQPDQWREFLPRLLSGDYRLEKRMMLRAGHWRAGKQIGEWQVVNEVVVCRGQYVRPVRLTTEVDGYPMASYVADGIIAATPTGSTAYALAAGGAILPPDIRNIIMVPIAPHLSPDRPIVLSEGACVKIKVHAGYEAVLSIDGHPPVVTREDDNISVTASDHNTIFIRFHDPGYFYRSLNRYLEQNPAFPDQ
jgi:NAD+ kinase